MTWDLESNVTDLSDSKLLAGLGVMGDVQPDGCRYIQYDGNIIFQTNYENFWGDDNCYLFYRLDKLLSVLPEWVYTGSKYGYDDGLEIIDINTEKVTKEILLQKGQPAIKAAVQLIKLLKEEGLL